jgi:hypothetical protein
VSWSLLYRMAQGTVRCVCVGGGVELIRRYLAAQQMTTATSCVSGQPPSHLATVKDEA